MDFADTEGGGDGQKAIMESVQSGMFQPSHGRKKHFCFFVPITDHFDYPNLNSLV